MSRRRKYSTAFALPPLSQTEFVSIHDEIDGEEVRDYVLLTRSSPDISSLVIDVTDVTDVTDVPDMDTIFDVAQHRACHLRLERDEGGVPEFSLISEHDYADKHGARMTVTGKGTPDQPVCLLIDACETGEAGRVAYVEVLRMANALFKSPHTHQFFHVFGFQTFVEQCVIELKIFEQTELRDAVNCVFTALKNKL